MGFCMYVNGPQAMSAINSVGSQSSDGMRMCVCVCADRINFKCALCWHIHIPVHSMLCQCVRTSTHTHTSSYHLRTVNQPLKMDFVQTKGSKETISPKYNTQICGVTSLIKLQNNT